MPKSEKFQSLPAPWDRIFALTTRSFVWGLLFAIIYILRPFFLLIFLTFVFAYIQSHGVEGLAHRFSKRVYRVLLVFVVFLGVIIGTLYFLVPHIEQQTTTFSNNWGTYARDADKAIWQWTADKPDIRKLLAVDDGTTDNTEPGKENNGENVKSPAPGSGQAPVKESKKPDDASTQAPDSEPPAITAKLIKDMFGLSTEGKAKDGSNLKDAMGKIVDIGTGVIGATSAFLLSILFSFLIVLDLPKFRRSVAGLQQTKLDFIYAEVADNIHEFGKVLGRALEAQLLIAICNTVLTAIGIWFLGLENIIFLSTIVFFCSFIPVAGVFISSAPICLLALQSGDAETSGVVMMLLAIGLILLIHFVEAYFLNPRIFGHHLHMNAVMVLIVLTIAGKIFGVWGLVLGLPMVNYIFGSAIRHDPDEEDDEDGGSGDLEEAVA